MFLVANVSKCALWQRFLVTLRSPRCAHHTLMGMLRQWLEQQVVVHPKGSGCNQMLAAETAKQAKQKATTETLSVDLLSFGLKRSTTNLQVRVPLKTSLKHHFSPDCSCCIHRTVVVEAVRARENIGCMRVLLMIRFIQTKHFCTQPESTHRCWWL